MRVSRPQLQRVDSERRSRKQGARCEACRPSGNTNEVRWVFRQFLGQYRRKSSSTAPGA